MKANNFFTSKFFYILVSIFFAVILFFNANSVAIRNQGSTQNTGEVYTASINNVPIDIKYDSNKYFISGYIGTANVYLTGYNQLQIANEQNADTRSFYLTADLTGTGPGTTQVPIRFQSLPSGVNAQASPATLAVTIENKTSARFDVVPQFSATQVPEGFNIDGISLSATNVKVTAGTNSIKQIHAIEATLPSDVVLNDDYSGSVTLHAIDKNGKVVSAQISPATVQMKVSVEKLTKTVPVNVKTTGTLANNIASVKTSLDHQTVQISGEKKYLDMVTSLDAQVDVSNVTQEKTVKVKLHANNGVVIDPQTISVTISPVKK